MEIEEMGQVEDLHARQLYNESYPTTELVASVALHEDEKMPARLSDQHFWVEAEAGRGKLLFSASEPIDFSTPMPGIRDVKEIQHGVMGNSSEYFNWAMEAYAEDVASGSTMVVACQFNRAFDPIDHDTLRFGVNGWRCAEPCQRPLPPIDSFRAKDAFRDALSAVLPDLRTWTMHGNSEGAQMGYWEAAVGESLDRLEAVGVQVRAEPTNPGNVPYFHAVRPVLVNQNDPVTEWRFAWVPIDSRSEENRFSYGIHNCSPYVAQYLQTHGVDTAMANLVRRFHGGVGLLDSDAHSSQLPVGTTRQDPDTGRQLIGHGPLAQGTTRLERSVAFWDYLDNYARTRGIVRPAMLRLLPGGHSGRDAVRVSREYDLGTSEEVGFYPGRSPDGRPDPGLSRVFTAGTSVSL